MNRFSGHICGYPQRFSSLDSSIHPQLCSDNFTRLLPDYHRCQHETVDSCGKPV